MKANNENLRIEIKKDIEKVASKKKTGQKNAETLLPALDRLIFFSPDLSLLPILLDCTTTDVF